MIGKFLIIMLTGVVIIIAAPVPLNIQCMTDMECERMFGPDEGEDEE